MMMLRDPPLVEISYGNIFRARLRDELA